MLFKFYSPYHPLLTLRARILLRRLYPMLTPKLGTLNSRPPTPNWNQMDLPPSPFPSPHYPLFPHFFSLLFLSTFFLLPNPFLPTWLDPLSLQTNDLFIWKRPSSARTSSISRPACHPSGRTQGGCRIQIHVYMYKIHVRRASFLLNFTLPLVGR
jgi:hypothetical protein